MKKTVTFNTRYIYKKGAFENELVNENDIFFKELELIRDKTSMQTNFKFFKQDLDIFKENTKSFLSFQELVRGIKGTFGRFQL